MAVGGEDVLMLGGVSNPSPVVLTDAQLLSRSTEEEIDPIVSEIFGELVVFSSVTAKLFSFPDH